MNAAEPIGIPGSGGVEPPPGGAADAAETAEGDQMRRGEQTRTQETFGAAAPGRRVLYSASWVLRAPPPER
jgi:hypothetical protein